MEINEFSEKIQKQIMLLDKKLSEKQLNSFYKYMNLLLEWNEKINLTAITDKDEIITKHFIDCLTITKYIKENSKMIDIGTGAGFPGIPVKIEREDVNIILLDSLNKRINFLNEVIKEIDLKNIETIHSRVEDFANNKENREKFDIVTSRAVASLNVLLEYMLPLTKVGGKCICMKGANIDEEIKMSQKALKILGGEIEEIEEFTLPNTDIKRNIIIVKKIKETQSKYPRKAGTPSKSPIV